MIDRQWELTLPCLIARLLPFQGARSLVESPALALIAFDRAAGFLVAVRSPTSLCSRHIGVKHCYDYVTIDRH